MNKIPKTIHQTWKNDILPYHLKLLSETWKNKHPDWNYILWTDEMCRNLIAQHFPYFLNKYDDYPANIQRVDAFRYFVLYKYGGVYVDLDFECFDSIDSLINTLNFVVGIEPALHAERFSMDQILCNAFMASKPGDMFMKEVCDKLSESFSLKLDNPTDVLQTTGPFFLTKCYEESLLKEDVDIIPADTLYPITLFESKLALEEGIISEETQTKINNSKAVHYFLGTW